MKQLIKDIILTIFVYLMIGAMIYEIIRIVEGL